MPFTAFALAVCSTLAAGPSPDAGEAQMKASMHVALGVVAGLQPYLASAQAFRDPNNASHLSKSIDALAGLRHFFVQPAREATGTTDVASLFGRQLTTARAEFAAKDTEAARFRLRNVSFLCLACHVREPGATFDAAQKTVDTLNLTPLERAQFYALTRQFDRALGTWSTALVVKPSNDVEAFEQAQALRIALDVTVRGKDDAAAAVALLKPQAGRKELPGFVAREATGWLTEAQAWQAEHFDASRETPQALVAKAKGLLTMTGAAGNVSPDDVHFVSSLRAAAYLEEALRREPTAPWRGEALFLAGVVSASVNDPLLWQLEWLYLEACITENPHSALATQCADRLVARTFFSYSGWGNIPADVAARLVAMRKLSMP